MLWINNFKSHRAKRKKKKSKGRDFVFEGSSLIPFFLFLVSEGLFLILSFYVHVLTEHLHM